jgi:hypothetical protein
MSSPSEVSARFATVLGIVIGAGIAILSPADDADSKGSAKASVTIASGDGGKVDQGWGSPFRTSLPSRGQRFALIPDLD